MMGSGHEVREAGVGEVDAVARVLTRAFVDDPIIHWVFDRASVRQRSSYRFFHWWTSDLIDQGVTWTSSSGDALGGAAVWALPGQWKSSAVHQLRLVPRVATGVMRPVRVIRGITGIEHDHPKEPHLYLALLGVDPAQQGTGLGSALIAQGLQLADEERWPAYLESSNPANLDFYGRHGFAVFEEIVLPKGPPVFRMWREPR